jgi:hypothetical protein
MKQCNFNHCAFPGGEWVILDGHKREKLNIIMDHCGGQNKDQHALQLTLCLIHKGCFADVKFLFLVVGHAKNVADRFFNIAKILSRKMHIFSTAKKLVEALNHAEQVDSGVASSSIGCSEIGMDVSPPLQKTPWTLSRNGRYSNCQMQGRESWQN